MKRFLFLLQFTVFLFSQEVYSQANCVTGTSFTVNPQPTNSTYAPGTVVTYCFTVNGYTQAGANWFEGFDINLGPGWMPGSVTPVSAPANCGGGGGQWIWMNSSTSTTTPIQTFGPGYFFDLNGNGIAGDDFGDAGNCVWTMCFSVTVGNVVGTALTMQIAPLSDGVAGSWGSSACDGVNYTTMTPSSVVVGVPCNINGAFSSSTNILCFGASTGSLTVAPSTGTAPYTYSLNGGASQPTGTFNNLAAGNYTVQIVDANLCTVNIPVTLTQPAFGMIAQVVTFDHVDCNGQATGSFEVTGLMGVAPLQFSLNGAPNSPSGIFSNLVAGNYTVVVTDASGCTAQVNHQVTQPIPLTVSLATQVNVDCFGGTDGFLQVNGNGGTAPYTFAINTGATPVAGNSFNNLPAGVYTITVTDANNCTATSNYTITEPISPVALSAQTLNHVSCFNGNDGSFSVAGNGGTAPYTFSVNGGVSTPTTSYPNLTAGNYQVTVTDANGCTSQINISVAQPPLPVVASLNGQMAVSCFGGNDGSASFNALGGTAPYTFTVGAATNGTGVFNNLSAGNYSVIATDVNGCTSSLNFTITEPAAALSSQIVNQTNVLCSGTATGGFSLSASNGTAPYQFTLAGTTNTTGLFGSLTQGLYNVTVTDANGCTVIQPVNLTSPTALSSNIIAQTNVSCFGGNDGSVTVTGVNGTGALSYTLNGNTNANGQFSSLAAGSYNVIITDQNNCTFTQVVNITQPSAAVGGSTVSNVSVSCNGLSDATIQVAGTGGTPGYTYSLAGGPSANGSFSNLAAGNYTILITDQNACTFNYNVTVVQPAVLSGATLALQNVDCFGNASGSVSLSANGGTAPFQFTLNATTNTSGVFNLLVAGNYPYTIVDANGCIYNNAIAISEPALPLSLSIANQQNVSCFGASTGQVMVAANGGTPVYQYAIQGTTWQASPTFSTLPANTYTIIVVDQNACTATVPVSITQPPQGITIALVSVTDVLCFGANTGDVVVNSPTGLAPITFQLGAASNQTGIFPGVPAGNYTVTATDANGCLASVNAIVNQPATPLSLVIQNQTNVTCNGFANGSVSVLAGGGTVAGAYQYVWNTIPVQVTNVASNLVAGNYNVVITDDNGCTSSLNVTISEPNFQINLLTNLTICSGESVPVNATSLDGAAPVTYTFTDLSNGGVYTANPWNCNLTASATIQVDATDNNGCVAPSQSFIVTVNPVPVADFVVDMNEGCIPFCPTFTCTSVNIPGTHYQWSFGDGTSALSPVVSKCFSQAGVYDVSLQLVGPSGCADSRTDSALIDVFIAPLVDFVVDNPEMTTENAEVIVINRSNPSLSFLWDMGEIEEKVTGFQPEYKYTSSGDFCIELIGTDQRGCVAVDQECVKVLDPYRLFLPSAFTPNGDERNDEFKAYGQEFKQQHMRIYDRWGGLIFEDQGPKTVSWRAENVPDGVYTYLLIVLDNLGQTQRYNGTVTVYR